MNNLNKIFWNNYYTDTQDNINMHSSFSNFVYVNYIEKYNNNNIFLKICDIGAGNCRDTKYFNNKGNLCYGVDINGILDKEYNNCKLIKKDVTIVLQNYELHMLFDIFYMRWFLHALPYNISNTIFTYAVRNLKPNGIICVEVRSKNDNELIKASTYDTDDKSYTTTHKRWLYDIDMCKKLASENDCDIIYCEEDYFSPNHNTETTNPLLIRFICKKRLLPYYEKSINYNKYKHIIPKMSYCTTHYNKMDIMNSLLEQYNIKYVAVAGTSLGLSRHGGIIPWDNDIDIGFLEEEWDKLFSIKDKLKENGLEYASNGTNHCHFGPIDCFKLKLINNYYEGPAKTYCSIDEYNNTVKQVFGYTYIYAPFCNHKSLEKRYGVNYFNQGNVNDNFHFKDHSVKIFNLDHNDLSYQLQ